MKLRRGDRVYGKRAHVDGNDVVQWFRGGNPLELKPDVVGKVTAVDLRAGTFDVGEVTKYEAPPISGLARKVPRWARRRQ